MTEELSPRVEWSRVFAKEALRATSFVGYEIMVFNADGVTPRRVALAVNEHTRQPLPMASAVICWGPAHEPRIGDVS